jgi:hypothetical protein
MSEFKPFADDTASVSIGGLTVENGTERLALYGSLDVARDDSGLAALRRLRRIVDEAVAVLEAGPRDGAGPDAPTVEVGNPFA